MNKKRERTFTQQVMGRNMRGDVVHLHSLIFFFFCRENWVTRLTACAYLSVSAHLHPYARRHK